MELTVTEVLLLAVVQGVTEFLPISSSGHVVILATILGDEDLDVSGVNIVLHGGTLLSILVFYWQRVIKLLAEDRRLIKLLVLGTMPAVALGLPLKLFAAELLSSPLLAGMLLPVTGLILAWSVRHANGEGHYQELNASQALQIGFGQALAVLPGLSRSGTTIAVGMRLGLSPTNAATFSFLLAIPAIAGACVIETKSLLSEASLGASPSSLIAGAVVSFLVGLFSLWWLVHWLERGRFQDFAWWCIIAGIAVVTWQLAT